MKKAEFVKIETDVSLEIFHKPVLSKPLKEDKVSTEYKKSQLKWTKTPSQKTQSYHIKAQQAKTGFRI